MPWISTLSRPCSQLAWVHCHFSWERVPWSAHGGCSECQVKVRRIIQYSNICNGLVFKSNRKYTLIYERQGLDVCIDRLKRRPMKRKQRSSMNTSVAKQYLCCQSRIHVYCVSCVGPMSDKHEDSGLSFFSKRIWFRRTHKYCQTKQTRRQSLAFPVALRF